MSREYFYLLLIFLVEISEKIQNLFLTFLGTFNFMDGNGKGECKRTRYTPI